MAVSQVIVPALDEKGAGLEKLYDGGGGGGHGIDGCCSGVAFEKWVAKNLSSKCVCGLGRSLMMTMMMNGEQSDRESRKLTPGTFLPSPLPPSSGRMLSCMQWLNPVVQWCSG